MRQGPMLYRLAESAPAIDLRFIDNQKYPQLRDELRIAGGARVPVAVILSEDYFEISRLVTALFPTIGARRAAKFAMPGIPD